MGQRVTSSLDSGLTGLIVQYGAQVTESAPVGASTPYEPSCRREEAGI
jgi:hypothetical protein